MGKKIKIKVKKPWIAYPGCPVQQNYAEDLEHGYLLWNISNSKDWDVKLKSLPNPKPFVTLSWNGSFEDLDESSKTYPRGTRYRIRSSIHISQKEIQQINSLLYEKRGASEITHKSDVVIDKSIIKAGTSSLAKNDLRSTEVLLKLVKDHHKNSVVSEETWSKVSETIKNVLSTVTLSEETIRNSKWSLRYLGFDNMFTYGEDNLINFDALNGIVGIFGPNRIGKSSVVGTVMYSLFNTTDRGPMKNIHICNVRKPYCSSKAIINYNGVDYIIERQTTKSENKKGVISASTSLNLYKMKEDGEAEELNGEQRTDTEKTIRSLIGNNEDFLLTSLSAQGEINQFIMQGSSRRRAILSRFLDLDVFDKMYDLVNKEANVFKAQLKNYPDRAWSNLLDQTEDEIKISQKLIDDLDQSVQENQVIVSQLQIELHKNKDFSPVTQAQLDVQKKKISSLEESCRICSTKIESLENDIFECTKKINVILSVKEENDINSLRNERSKYKDLESSLITLKHSFEKEVAVLQQQQKSLKILDEVPCGDEYSHCKFIKDAYLSKEKIVEQTSTTQTLKKNLEATNSALDSIKLIGSLEKLEKLEKLIDLERKIELELSKKETELAQQKSACDLKLTDLSTEKDRLRHLEESQKNQENVEAVFIKSNLEELSRSIKELNTKKIEAATKKGMLTAALQKYKDEKSARDAIFEKLKIQEMVATAFSKKGIPLVITKSQLPAINIEIAKILHGIVDFSIELENDDDSDSSEIYINYGDSRRMIELCSGMEKTIASLAVRVAMINVSSLPRPDIFIIDEGFGTLDDASIEACNRLLVSLKKYFKVIVVITHVDGIKDVVDHVLEITKNEKDTKLVYRGE